MRNDYYPPTVRALLDTDFVSPQTKKVLVERLEKPVVMDTQFFSAEEFQTLQAVSKRLLPQPSGREYQIDLVGIVDSQFVKGNVSNGWRYDAMPDDEAAVKKGLQAVEATAQHRYNTAFHELDNEKQDAILKDIQHQKVTEEAWNSVPSHRFFEELFAALVEVYYSHPVGKEEIGDVSFADTKGWHQIGLNQLEKREPKAEEK